MSRAFCCPIPGKRSQKGVVAVIDRARDARHRQREGARRRFRTDACDGEQRFEELALDARS